ncbi:MAG: 3-phosphoshikimate 1-carboxyvinyltransferase [Candidatus Altiarchaeum hamiconexum]|uniref:3-phosphoshikimate 1-carboxyvinyltransferase n=1 Tax=Candidatus Altarchaeum hamiconexum TaxID=1803513 RepID=A0A8J7YU97_9ARCH|nr:3-phosphoshikimate 1-carboxyvinyltransferase [Candidatus Altarchaeum hamiconexum]OIQ06350.1 MAG: 3-phosphoshikimate 1-carboxyvinyltransferase [Candidatus Altarchaeum sp. CG2_30_32_3053]PIN67076.1 MAG: 3-phosphoshikimate 1-carboxyvinyltransferase [Candidatus Altarchaeum sp. CG12_big_fil_rev_8_21_14_0_65_33_22]PIV27272.1 MAG: 3-phosphoshikimate 1-carboxyvinyltransferase [Candidatus Altarchaeum sp. CG03_land_8_20_14_0_80_32_618]PIZ31684.1 MAG: 3-phosphoshikimate 1-carboxyvinyltransferase [Candi
MKKKLMNTFLKGTIDCPPSKSYTHRAIICASLANGTSRITNYLKCNDTAETISALRMLDIDIKESDRTLEINGNENLNTEINTEISDNITIDCIKESGSTFRFFIPLASLSKAKKVTFVREGRLKARPVEPLLDALNNLGVKCSIEKDKKHKNKDCVVIYPGIKGGKTSISGNISSQFISGLLFACPRAKKDTEINVTTDIESKPYIELTLDVLKDFGIEVDVSEDMKKFKIHGNQHYKAREKFMVEGDYSSAAFLLAAGAINGDVEVKNLNVHSQQGDKEILNILKQMCAEIEIKENKGVVHVLKSNLKGIEIDAQNIPDLVPVCAVLGCYAEGETKIFNAGRLRLKESDRLLAITTGLKKMNADIAESEDGLLIHKSDLKGAEIDPHNDHRIAMSCAVAGLNAKGETIINDAECVNKSYPSFFEDIERLKFKNLKSEKPEK